MDNVWHFPVCTVGCVSLRSACRSVPVGAVPGYIYDPLCAVSPSVRRAVGTCRGCTGGGRPAAVRPRCGRSVCGVFSSRASLTRWLCWPAVSRRPAGAPLLNPLLLLMTALLTLRRRSHRLSHPSRSADTPAIDGGGGGAPQTGSQTRLSVRPIVH